MAEVTVEDIADMLQLISEGRTYQEVADTLYLSRRGVDYRMTVAYRRFGLHNFPGDKLVRVIHEAIRTGFIKGPPRIAHTVSFNSIQSQILELLMAGYTTEQIVTAGYGKRSVQLNITLMNYACNTNSRVHLVAVVSVLKRSI